MNRRYVFLFLFSLLLGLPGIASLPVLDRDEARFVQSSKQMVESSNYFDIRLQDETRYKKPIGIYWLQSAAVAVSGQGAKAPIWVYRAVSALGIALAVVAVAWTGTNLFGNQAGMAAGLVLAGIFATALEGRIAKTDGMLLFACTLAQGALAQIYLAHRRGEQPSQNLAWLFWVAQGFGIIIKGPVAPILSSLTIISLFAFDRDARYLTSLKAVRGVLVAALIVLPWLVSITVISDGAFWRESVGNDMLGKVVSGQESHGMPPGYYVLTYSLFMWPFGLLAISAGLQALPHLRDNVAVRFCLAWYVPFWLLFEAIPTKLPHYVLPAYAALALLIGWAATRNPEDVTALPKLWQRMLFYATAFGLVVVSTGVAVGVVAAPLYFNGQFSWWSIPAAIAALATGYLALTPKTRTSVTRIGATAVCAGVTYAIVFAAIVPSLEPMWLTKRIAEAVEQNRPCAQSRLATSRYHEMSLVFALGTETIRTNLDGAAQHLLADPACAMALVPAGDEAALNAQLAAQGKTTRRVATIDGLNYSNGNQLSLGLYIVAP